MSAIETRGATGAPERFALGTCRDRWLEFLGLEHAVLPAPVAVEREGRDFLVWRGRLAARPVAQGRIPQPWRAPLLLQAASAAAFFSSRGFALTSEDLETSAWDTAAGTARLWLTRTPESVREASATPVVEALRPFLARLFGRGGRLSPEAARELGAEMSAPEAARLRGEIWVARALRAFPGLARPEAAAARERCLGVGSEAIGGARSRAFAETARAVLRERDPRVFEPPPSALTPGGALRLDPPPDGVGDATRRLREHARERARPVWIAVERERWDSLSRRAFDAARLALGDAVEVVEVGSGGGFPETPADWRRALWVPCGAVAASVRFYEWFAELVRSDPARARDRLRRILASPGWAEFVADPTGDAPLPHAAEAADPPPPRVRAPDSEPGERIEELLAAGRAALAVREAEKWIREFPQRRAEAWFALSARLSAAVPAASVPWLEALEAEREIAGGRPRDALARLERLGRSGAGSAAESRRARLRAAEVAVMLGRHAEAARRAAAWRREHPDAPARESVRALALGAAGLAREGRTDCALALMEEADRLGGDASELDRLETGLARARVFALAGRYAEEDAVYETLRPFALGAADERLAIRFLAQEARALLDRRQYAKAAVRLEEALGVSPDDPAERAGLLLDLAATVYHAGDEARCESLLDASLQAAAAAGREDVARIARGNRVELLINRCAWEVAAREIAELEASAVSERDDPRRLVVLHHRARLALRRGRLEEAARANAEARTLSERLGDRLEIGELWLEEGDRLLYEGNLAEARDAWERAAADPPDRCRRDRAARERLEELAWRDRGGPPETAREVLEAGFAADPYAAAESLARWARLFGEAAIPAETRERAQRVLRAGGGQALADRVFGPASEPLPEQTVRSIRDAVSGALAGERPAAEGLLLPLGLAGLAVRDEERREFVRLGALPPPPETVWRTLQAGAARFELALWPEPSGQTAASVALVVETLLLRAAPEPAADSFCRGVAAARRRDGRRLDGGTVPPAHAFCAAVGDRADSRRVGFGKGGGRQGGPPALAALRRSVRRRQRAGDSPGPARERALRPRPGRLHGRRTRAAGPARGSLRRHDLLRRDRRPRRSRSRPSFCALCRSGRSAASARTARAPSTCAWPRRPRGISSARSRRAAFARTSTTGCTSRSFDCRRCASAGGTRSSSPGIFWNARRASTGGGGCGWRRRRRRRSAAYAWPGNVRELQNAMAQAAALGDRDGDVTVSLLPESARPARPHGTPSGDYRSRVDAHRRDLIADALGKAGGNRSRAARDLGLSRQALHYLMRELKVAVKPANGKP